MFRSYSIHGSSFFSCAVPRANHLLRTVSPTQVTEFATAHDARVLHCFERLLGLTPGAETEQSHEISRDLWVRQVRLPFRFGGCGLRSSLRTAPAAHWASWADALPVLRVRFPSITEAACRAMDAASNAESIARLPQSLGDAVAAGRGLDEAGFRSRPSWHELSRGSFPRLPSQTSSRAPTTYHTGGSFTPVAFWSKSNTLLCSMLWLERSAVVRTGVLCPPGLGCDRAPVPSLAVGSVQSLLPRPFACPILRCCAPCADVWA